MHDTLNNIMKLLTKVMDSIGKIFSSERIGWDLLQAFYLSQNYNATT